MKSLLFDLNAMCPQLRKWQLRCARAVIGLLSAASAAGQLPLRYVRASIHPPQAQGNQKEAQIWTDLVIGVSGFFES